MTDTRQRVRRVAARESRFGFPKRAITTVVWTFAAACQKVWAQIHSRALP
jgi:hypothetical protein